MVEGAVRPRRSATTIALRAVNAANVGFQKDLTSRKRELLRVRHANARTECRNVPAWMAAQLESLTILRRGPTEFLGRKILPTPPLRRQTRFLSFASPAWVARHHEYYVRLQKQLTQDLEEKPRAQQREHGDRSTQRFAIFACLRNGWIFGSIPGLVDVEGSIEAGPISQSMMHRGRHLTPSQIGQLYG
ncbi:MAG: hypothetical protein M1826_002505 [Phylliscum demangeonii]|nr:MAG: hypothetical protein M1826_002505 [Phylliscum demangeonii]